ncbi:MAG: glycoside hydrolase family 16 protein, partial [Bacteroidota bacterium]
MNNKNIKIKKVFIFPTFLLAILFLITSCETDPRQQVVSLSNLVMADEFNEEGAPDPTLWTYDLGTGNEGWGNFELQTYTDRTENVKVENGFLLITAREEDFDGAAYTSARLKTQGLFEQQYGRFEARIRLPYGKGLWPAFWLLGNDCDQNIWPLCGEIDIMENLGDSPNVVFGSVHGP